MRFITILNRDGGTLRTADIDDLRSHIMRSLREAGHEGEVRIVRGRGIESALKAACGDPEIDVVMAGGGDGTISAAAASLMDTDKALAILPAGTMNLYARGLGIPLDLKAAIDALVTGQERAVDMATANGRPFVHQFSIGLHARVVQLRSRFEYGSRLGKMMASVRAGMATVSRPPSIDIAIDMGEAEVLATTAGVGISNNLFGEGHLPFADVPDGGILGIYVSSAATRTDLIRIFLAMARGRLRETNQVEIHESRMALLTIRSPLRRQRCVIDGELHPLEKETLVRIHPGALKVLVPAAES